MGFGPGDRLIAPQLHQARDLFPLHRLDARLGAGLRLGDARLAQQGHLLRTPQGIEVIDVIVDRCDLQAVEFEAQPAEVVVRLLHQGAGEGFGIGVHLFGGEGGEHPAQVALQGHPGQLAHLLGAAVEQALDGGMHHRLMAGDLDVRHRRDADPDAGGGEGLGDGDGNVEVAEVEGAHLLEQGHQQGAAALEQAVAAGAGQAVDHQRLVGLADRQQAVQPAT